MSRAASIEPALPGRSFLGHRAHAADLGPAVVGGIALLVYLRTLLPGLAFGDWGEMQTVPHILGVAHPTGYPTYILLAWLTELVPIGSVAFRSNVLSAVLVAASLATATAIAGRLGVRPLVAVAAGLGLGAVGTIWAAATVAEVNPLHLLLCALLIHRALVWEARRATVDLVLGGLLVGLAVGNHLLTLFVAPFIVLFVAWVGRRELLARPWLVVPAVLALVLGLSVYAYIPIAASRVAGAALQPPGQPRGGPVAGQRRAVPRPVRLPLEQGPGDLPRLARRPARPRLRTGDPDPAAPGAGRDRDPDRAPHRVRADGRRGS